MEDDTLHWASRILNMDLTGADPGPLPRHVRILGDEELVAFVDALRPVHQIPNQPDEFIYEHDELGQVFAEPADAWDETTDTQRDYELTIAFDAETELEAMLAAEALRGFVQRRLKLIDPVLTARANQ